MRNQIVIAGLLAAVLLPMFSNDAEACFRRRCRRSCYTVSHCAPSCCNHCGNACYGGSCNTCNQNQYGYNNNYGNPSGAYNNGNPSGYNNMNSGTVPQPMSRPNVQSPAAPAPPPPTPVR